MRSKIYLLVPFNDHGHPSITSMSFYGSLELAKDALRLKAKELRTRLGCHVSRDTDTEFSFTLGWEEHSVSWRVIEQELIGQ